MTNSFFYTRATLKADLQSWAENTGTQFVSNLDKIIQLGELLLLRDLDLELFDTTTTKATANGVERLERPTDMVSPRSLHYTEGGNVVHLKPRSYEYVKDYGSTGSPLYYAEFNETNWILAPVPTGIITVTVRYRRRPDGLADVAADTTTWLSKNVPDVLLYACLASTEGFLKSDERVPLWQAEYKRILPTARAEATRLMRTEYGR